MLRKLYHRLPLRLRLLIRTPLTHAPRVPGVKHLPWFRRNAWVRDTYTAFSSSQRNYLYLSMARFLHINRPIPGYYFEFGCHEANTMRMAWSAFRHLFDFTYVAFDSFEGLPEMEDFDRSTIFTAGNLQTTEDAFIRIVTKAGMPREKLLTVKGFYDTSLTEGLKERLVPRKAAVVYIDCDLYKSTVPVLTFIVPFLQKGTIIVFDDWNCYHGDPAAGERRAWAEFLAAHPDLHFVEFVSTGEAQAFICVNPAPLRT